MKIRAALAGAAFVLVLAACDSERRAISRDDLPDVPEKSSVTIELGDEGFDISEIEVSTQDLVEFVNGGDDDHGIRTEDSSIDTGLLLPGESTHVIFDKEARYDLFDVADESHTMIVVATDPAEPTS